MSANVGWIWKRLTSESWPDARALFNTAMTRLAATLQRVSDDADTVTDPFQPP